MIQHEMVSTEPFFIVLGESGLMFLAEKLWLARTL
jgi:hypothetical protein